MHPYQFYINYIKYVFNIIYNDCGKLHIYIILYILSRLKYKLIISFLRIST